MSTGLGPGEVFAGHRIEAELGRGGMGIVYLARHIALDRPRAIKVLSPELSGDARFAERFRRESRLAASIEHPNVVTIHHAGEQDGRLYLAMQYIEGTDLHRALAAGPLEPARAAAIIDGVGAALDAAHERGLIHRDVKPANVLLGAGVPGGAEHPYLTDFGISKLAAASDPDGPGATVEQGLTSTGAVLGTTGYISPEQVEGAELTPRADVYALACVAFHALTGRPPFPRDTQIATLMAHAKADRPRASGVAPGLPGAVDAALARGMAIDPAERPATAGEFAAEVRDAVGRAMPAATRPVATVPSGADGDAERAASVAEPGRQERAFRRRLRLGLAVFAAAGGILLAVLLTRGGDEEPDPLTTAPAGGGAERPRSILPEATIPVGSNPTGVAVGELRIWAAAKGADAVYRIDPETNRRDGDPVALPGAKSVAVGHGSIWAVGAGTVTRLDPAQGPATAIEGAVDPVDIATDEDWVWVTDAGVPGRDGPGNGRLLRVDPATNQVDGTAPVGLDPRSVAAADGFVWVANAEDGTVTKVDAGSVRPVGRPIEAGTRPTNIAVGEGGIWVTDFSNAELLRIDPERDRVTAGPVEVGPRPRGVAAGSGAVWVASGELGEVWPFDPETLELVPPIRRVGDDPADLAIGAGGVWTADSGDGTVTRSKP